MKATSSSETMMSIKLQGLSSSHIVSIVRTLNATSESDFCTKQNARNILLISIRSRAGEHELPAILLLFLLILKVCAINQKNEMCECIHTSNILILWSIDPLLGKYLETEKETTAVA
jgi:hypothetical protein